MKSLTSLELEGVETDDWLFYERFGKVNRAFAEVVDKDGLQFRLGGLVAPTWTGKPFLHGVEFIFGPRYRSHTTIQGVRIREVRVYMLDEFGNIEQGVIV